VNKFRQPPLHELCKEERYFLPCPGRLVHLSNVADLFWRTNPDFVIANDYAIPGENLSFWNLLTLIGGE